MLYVSRKYQLLYNRNLRNKILYANNPSTSKATQTAERIYPGYPRYQMAGATGFEPATYGFGDRRSTN